MKSFKKYPSINITIIFLIFIISMPIITMAASNDFSQDLNADKKEDLILQSEMPQSQSLIPENHAYDNLTHRYIFFLDPEISFDNDILINFTACGGVLKEGPWETMNGFAGQINNSKVNLAEFFSRTPDLSIVEDSLVETQMNTVHDQLNIYPAMVDSRMNFTGNSNGSIAFLDTGIDDSFVGFENGYDELNFSSSIIGWNDFTEENELDPIDSHGHGTSIASIAIGSANKSLEVNHTNDEYYISVGGTFDHFDLFYPHHITPQYYSLKLATFEMDSEALDVLTINGQINTIKDLSNFYLELYQDNDIINSSAPNSLDLSWDTSGEFDESKKAGLYDVYIMYEVELGKNPQFDLLLNITFTPENYDKLYANFAGIAPETKVTSLKVLNSTGLGYSSDLISALEWVWENNSQYHIFVTVLSIGNFDMDDLLAQKISHLIDKVIDNGTMVIIAAGNNGVNTNMNALARNQKAIVVGSINANDQVTYYSSQGENLEGEADFWYSSDEVTKPDIVAPGGSYLPNFEMVLAADTNEGEGTSQISEAIYNDVTPVYGTSVSAAIVAGIYGNIVDLFGMWQNWNTTNGADALRAKTLLLMTASETNLQREDDPLTPYDESLESPQLNRGVADLHEGFGRVNPEAIGDLLSRTYPINNTIEVDLTSSSENAQAQHVYGINITLEQNKLYRFELNNEGGFFANLDADLYLYDNIGDQYGRPVILAAEPETGSTDEYFYYSNLQETQTYYLVAKAISGEGAIELNVTEQKYSNVTILQEANFTIESSYEYQDILDSFNFELNYTNTDNYPASEMYVHFNGSLEPVPMIRATGDDRNYTNGCMYYAQMEFLNAGTFSYNFSSQIGQYITNYKDPDENVVIVNPIHHEADFGYETDFSQKDSLWDLESGQENIIFQDTSTAAIAGWNHVSIPDTVELRNTSESSDSWEALYCGYSREGESNDAVFELNGNPFYYTGNNSESYELTSPIIFLNESDSLTPTLKLGLRISVGYSEYVSIEVRVNRSEWETLEEFSNMESNWFYKEYDLSNYLNNFTQIRVLSQWQGDKDLYNGGFMLDYFSLSEMNITNEFSPILSKYHDLSNPDVEQPFYKSATQTKFGQYNFQIAYTDRDGNMPEWVQLEIDGQFYNMSNRYGRYNPMKINPSDIRNEIVFDFALPIYYLTNSSFRFLASDGFFEVSTPWQPEITYNNLVALDFPITEEIPADQWTIIESGTPNSASKWVMSNSSWHQPSGFETTSEANSWYCGEGNYMGYGYNMTANLISPLIELGGTNEIFLTFDHRLRFETDGEAEGDYGEIFISTDFGETWKRLEIYDEETPGTEKVKVSIDISEFMNTEAVFRFKFTSDDSGTQVMNSGWDITKISIDINRTKDYDAPTIQFIGIENGDLISGVFDIEILIEDDSLLIADRTEFWINDDLIEIDIIDGKITYDLDTTQYENGEILEIICIVVDIEGNREVKKVFVEIRNPMSAFGIVMLSGGILIAGIAVFSKILHERNIKRKLLAGEIFEDLSFIERFNQRRFEKAKNFQESDIISTQTDPKWEKEQPFKLYCKKCKKYYMAPEFEIFCPSCQKDNLFIAKYCPACKKWNYFEEESMNHQCKSCELHLLKDFKEAKQEIQSDHYQNEKISKELQEQTERLEQVANDIPITQFKEIISKIVQEKEEELDNGRV